MEFTHPSYDKTETIAAIATPPGEGGISIIRLSGQNALPIADRIFSGPVESYATHTAHLGTVSDLEGNRIDQALLLLMRDGRSFTGEPTVEFHCHGGHLITRQILDALMKAGARLARPGEFSLRAFLNGKIDLAQAEAIQDLISAKSTLALSAAEQHLAGAFSAQIKTFQKELTEIAAILEAWVDFPEEGLEFASKEEITEQLTAIRTSLYRFELRFHDGKILSSDLSLCLLGAPNAGKSSLLNALSGTDRAIVTPIAGTTRDIIEERISFGGLSFRLIDTAGIRDTEEQIEKEGIRRAQAAAAQADLVLLVIDSTTGAFPSFSLPEGKTLVIWNKVDLSSLPPPPRTIPVSAKLGDGLDELKEAIVSLFLEGGLPSKDELIITKQRHFEAIRAARIALDSVISGLHTDLSPELLTSEIRDSLRSLGQIIGVNLTEDILTAIFSKFCVGK